MEEEYTEVVREFYALYRPLQKEHNLRYHMHFDLQNDGLIEIWEYEGEKQKRCISIAREENDIDCYRRATATRPSWWGWTTTTTWLC